MYDQLRHDYLGCAGHPTLETPNMDALASRGLRFSNAYVQSPVCGASRMSFYTGRYVSSHGAKWNGYPLRVGEMTLGDHLRQGGHDCWLIGKTHMYADTEGMERLGISRESPIGVRVGECGFDPLVRDDGLWAEGPGGVYDQKPSPYNAHLAARGYSDANPWLTRANAARNDDGEVATGWLMRHARAPADIDERDSETAWLTDRAIEFLNSDRAERPWLAHVSYIKPHWPYIAPAPYNDLYGPDDILPPKRDEAERADPHPVYRAFMENPVSRAFARDEVREAVIPAYMGLIRQCDDHLGRLLEALDDSGRRDETMIVLTSDHGDYLGDHWLGEKDLFHAASVKVPMILVDPREEADATRGQTSNALVEAIDLLPTFLDALGIEAASHWLEGRSLLPLLQGQTPPWRDVVISEYDYAVTPMADAIGVSIEDARLFMVADRRWKLVHAEGGFRPMLFDLESDPDELTDLGADPAYASTRREFYDRLFAWTRRDSQRVTQSDARILARRRGDPAEVGIVLGAWDEADVAPDVLDHLQSRGSSDVE